MLVVLYRQNRDGDRITGISGRLDVEIPHKRAESDRRNHPENGVKVPDKALPPAHDAELQRNRRRSVALLIVTHVQRILHQLEIHVAKGPVFVFV